MAKGTRIGSAVMFVQQLDRSVNFYEEVLAMHVADRSATAALLVSPAGSELILRAMGTAGAHPLGAVGVQYVIWTAADQRRPGPVRAGAQGTLRLPGHPEHATG